MFPRVFVFLVVLKYTHTTQINFGDSSYESHIPPNCFCQFTSFVSHTINLNLDSVCYEFSGIWAKSKRIASRLSFSNVKSLAPMLPFRNNLRQIFPPYFLWLLL